MRMQADGSFDERIYLAANPDVADAVSRGQFASGMEHFQKVGQKVGRIASAHLLG